MRVYTVMLCLLTAMLVLTACVVSPQLPYQYATLKLIERDAVTADAVIDRVERVRTLLDNDHELSVIDLEAQIKSIVGYSALPASDRLLVDALMGDLSHDLGIDVDTPLTDEHRHHLRQRLEWIAQAAAMAD